MQIHKSKTNKQFDCLTQHEINIAKQDFTNEEVDAINFNRSIPRGRDAGIRHYIFHINVIVLSILCFKHQNIGKLSYELSQKTTQLFDYHRFFHLYLLVRAIKPELVVEFGSGASTCFIAELLRYNRRKFGIEGKVISYEQSQPYYDKLMNNFPEELIKYAEIKLTPVKLKWFGKYRGIYYDISDFPDTANLVYIDGATRTRANQASDFEYQRINSDIIRMVRRGTVIEMAVTDHRYANYPFDKDELPDTYSIELSKKWRSIIIKNIKGN